MKRLLLAALTALTLLAIPASASASTSGAATAVKREIAYDYGDIGRGPVHVTCHSRSGGYACSIGFFDADDYVQGKARVTQRGSHYSVSYRIYW